MKTIDSLELHEMFADVNPCVIADGTYNCPTLSWLLGAFAQYYKDWLAEEAKQLTQWVEKFDCDDRAFLFKVLAQVCHAKTFQGIADGLAVGVVFYLVDADINKGHAINWAETDEGLVYIEPQTCQVVELSEDELCTRFFIYC